MHYETTSIVFYTIKFDYLSANLNYLQIRIPNSARAQITYYVPKSYYNNIVVVFRLFPVPSKSIIIIYTVCWRVKRAQIWLTDG